MDPDDIMVLDGGDEVYVWIGKGSTEEEKARSLDMAKVFINDSVKEKKKVIELISLRNTSQLTQLIVRKRLFL